MTVQKEVPMDDSELDALMADLDAETAGMVSAPAAVAKSAPAPEPEPVVAATTEDDELAALQAELEAEPAAKLEPVVEPELVRTPTPKAPVKNVEPVEAPKVALVEPVAAPVASATPPVAKPPRQQPTLQFYLDVEEFKNTIKVSENNLDDCMMQQAGLFASYAADAARAEAQHARVKLRFEVMEAKLYDRHRKALAAAGEKVTEKMVENEVKQDPEWLQSKNLAIEAEMVVGFNKGAVESLRHRKDMIVQLGADRREEYKGQTRIVASDDAHGSMKARALAAVA